ncbi:Anthocyanin 5-aromatic acyltransferase [Quillaja saponaria]|uniref:Anthocyanin 5-aromatic acyltransferase n=1 Tax=Quillaja saponaria TaxID=32244 RepID=A0AAD7PL90_QUISA|nr:Anthocyanin 5-aromatic acyltransferase [Quillaja saponaria]
MMWCIFEMGHEGCEIKVLDHCMVSPPAGSVPNPTTSLPLTFFDIKWLLKPKNLPVRRLSLYKFPHPTHHFMKIVFPSLKHSLSLTLQHFFPYAGKLVCPPQPQKPHILYVEDDSSYSSVPFTVTEWSTGDFNLFLSNQPKNVTVLHPFATSLPSVSTLEDGTRLVPLMAVQVTVLPNSGFGICVTVNHVAADGKAFLHFMKSWASICRTRGESLDNVPLHDRSVVEDPNGFELNLLKQWSSPW